MNQKDRLDLLKNIVKGIAKVMGESTEVVLHDLDRKEIVNIENSQVTGRAVGYRTNDSVFNAIVNLCDEDGHLIGYTSKSKQNRALRSSHFLIRDDDDNPRALICINQDVSLLTSLRDELDSLLASTRLKLQDEDQADGEEENSIHKIVTQLILEEIERTKPTALDTKEAKMKVLQSLHNKGIFSVKDAVPQVCDLLSISQATLYVYLREIRSRQEMQ